MRSLVSLNERYLNFHARDVEKKRLYADEVYDLLTAAYAQVGGLHGSGFGSPEQMIQAIPFWKLYRKDGDIISVLMYKEKAGRKVVVVASDGTDDGKRFLAKMMLDDMLQNRAYCEVSGPALSFMKRHMGADAIKSRAIPVDRVRRVLPGDDIVGDLADTDPDVVRHPDLADYFYQREIGGTLHTKVMLGNPSVL